MTDNRELWLIIRRALIMIVRAIDRVYNCPDDIQAPPEGCATSTQTAAQAPVSK